MAANDNDRPRKKRTAKRKAKKASKKPFVPLVRFRPLDELSARRYDTEMKKIFGTTLSEAAMLDLSDPVNVRAWEALGLKIRRLDSKGRPKKVKRSKATKAHGNERRRFARRKKKAQSTSARSNQRIVAELIDISKVRSKKKH